MRFSQPAIVLLLLTFVAGFDRTGCQASADELRPIQVVSYNIRLANKSDGPDYWPHRVDAVSEFISRWDVIGLQEVTPEQLTDLKERLGEDFDSYGLGRDDGKSKGEHAAVFFRRDRIEAIQQSTFWLCQTPDEPGAMGWDAACPRTVTWMRLRERNSGQEFVFANTHFDHVGVDARKNSASMIRQRLESLDKTIPFVLMGDFNCLPDSEPYKTLAAPPLRDAREVAANKIAGPDSTWNGFKKIAPDRIIDHAFVGESVRVVQFQIHNPKTSAGRFASDHLPVRLAIVLGKD